MNAKAFLSGIQKIYNQSFSSSNFAFIVGLPWVSFLMVKSSALSLANLRLFSDESNAALVFSNSLIVLSIPSMAS